MSWVAPTAQVFDSARVYGEARVYGSAMVSGEGRVSSNADIAWVDSVGSGAPMTLHRTRTGWRINAGCVHFEAPTVAEVVRLCAEETQRQVDNPTHWSWADGELREQWATQVECALVFLASMVKEER